MLTIRYHDSAPRPLRDRTASSWYLTADTLSLVKTEPKYVSKKPMGTETMPGLLSGKMAFLPMMEGPVTTQSTATKAPPSMPQQPGKKAGKTKLEICEVTP
jgi:hypothetical protein